MLTSPYFEPYLRADTSPLKWQCILEKTLSLNLKSCPPIPDSNRGSGTQDVRVVVLDYAPTAQVVRPNQVGNRALQGSRSGAK